MAPLLSRWKTPLAHHDAVRSDFKGDRSRVPDVANVLAIHIDADGSPVTMPESEWLVCFVPGLRRQWWHRFTHPKHKHVFAIRKIENDTWLLVEPWWTRLMVNVLTFDQAINFLRWGAAGHILKVRESIPGRGNQMRGWSNCAVLMAFLLGRSYWTWTPNGLYRRLVADAEVETIDLLPWLGEHFQSLADQVVDEVSNIPWYRAGQSLHDALLAQGLGLMTALTSPPANELRNAAMSESSAFQKAADCCWRLATNHAITSTLHLLEDTRVRGEIDDDGCLSQARNFVLMLLSGTRPRSVSTLRPVSDSAAIRRHVAAMVAAFLVDTTRGNDTQLIAKRAVRTAERQPLDALACR